jgi:hypothetical protein
MRDLAKFWSDLQARGLIGTIEQPRSGKLDYSPMEVAVEAVRATLEGRVPERKAKRRGAGKNAAASAAPEPIRL